MADAIKFKLRDHDLDRVSKHPQPAVEGPPQPFDLGMAIPCELGDLWIKGRLGACFYFSLGGVREGRQSPSRYFCIVVEKGNTLVEGNDQPFGTNSWRRSYLGVGLGDERANEMECAVPVDPRESVEPREGGVFRPILVTERLYRFDPGPVHVAEWLDLAYVSAEGGLGLRYWETKAARSWRRVAARIVDGGVVDSVIERGPEVIEQLPEEDWEIRWWRELGLDPEVGDSFFVHVERNVIRIIVKIGVPYFDHPLTAGLCGVQVPPASLE